MPSYTQSVLFKRRQWTVTKAIQWLYDHGHSFKKIDLRPETIRFRQVSPNPNHRYRIHRLGDSGVSLVLGFY